MGRCGCLPAGWAELTTTAGVSRASPGHSCPVLQPANLLLVEESIHPRDQASQHWGFGLLGARLFSVEEKGPMHCKISS